MFAEPSSDKMAGAKISMLKKLISKMQGLMADGHVAAESSALPHEVVEGEEPVEGSIEEEAMEAPEEEKSEDSLNPDDVKSFMGKSSQKPKAKHSMAMMSVMLGKAKPKGMPFKKK